MHEQEPIPNITTASIRNAAAVLRLLAEDTSVPSREYGEYLGVASRLERIADEREADESEPRRIPIPPEAMNDKSMEQVVEHVYGDGKY